MVALECTLHLFTVSSNQCVSIQMVIHGRGSEQRVNVMINCLELCSNLVKELVIYASCQEKSNNARQPTRKWGIHSYGAARGPVRSEKYLFRRIGDPS